MNDLNQNQIYIAFSNAPQKPYLKPLKSGFRHCMYIEERMGMFIIFDPLSSHSELMITPNSPIKNLVERGFTVIKVTKNKTMAQRLTFDFLTCVGQIKRLLGIQNFKLQTPYQLYKYLTKGQNKNV